MHAAKKRLDSEIAFCRFLFSFIGYISVKKAALCMRALTWNATLARSHYALAAAFVKYYEVFCVLEWLGWNHWLQLSVTLWKITEENGICAAWRFHLKMFGKCCASGHKYCVRAKFPWSVFFSLLFSLCRYKTFIPECVDAWTLHLLDFLSIYFHPTGASCWKLYAGNTTWTSTKRLTEWS